MRQIMTPKVLSSKILSSLYPLLSRVQESSNSPKNLPTLPLKKPGPDGSQNIRMLTRLSLKNGYWTASLNKSIISISLLSILRFSRMMPSIYGRISSEIIHSVRFSKSQNSVIIRLHAQMHSSVRSKKLRMKHKSCDFNELQCVVKILFP